MYYKVFNQGRLDSPGRTFLLVDPKNPKAQMKIPPKATANVPDNFAGDVTFRMAVESRELVIWQEAKEVDQLLQASEETAQAGDEPEKKPAKPAKNGKGAKKEEAHAAETEEADQIVEE